MSSDTSETPPTSEAPPSETAPKPKRRWLKIALVAIVAAVVLGSSFTYWWLTRPPQMPWLSQGAYAEYRGKAVDSLFSLNMTVHLEVVDYNDTHAKLLVYMRVETSLTEPVEVQDAAWVNLKKNTYEISGYNLERTYDDSVYVEGFGTRQCIVQEYRSAEETIIYYIDKEVRWPLKIAIRETDMNLELMLVETNIQGLKRQ